MTTRHGSVTGTVSAAPDAVFAVVTDIDRLPEWNDVIVRVLERPPALDPGAQWCVTIKPPGLPSWTSRSTVIELDRSTRRFRFRSQTDDGNPSYGEWTWTVDPAPDGARVTVEWDLHPETFWRRVLLSRIRHRALRTEVARSIARLGTAVTSPP